MQVKAAVRNRSGSHEAVVCTNEAMKSLTIAPKDSGCGSSVNGGELLLLALATCFCNDVYRAAAKRGLAIDSIEVTAEADFLAEGQAAENIRYRARVASRASEIEIRDLLRYVDEVAEIQRTVRQGVPITLELVTIEPRD